MNKLVFLLFLSLGFFSSEAFAQKNKPIKPLSTKAMVNALRNAGNFDCRIIGPGALKIINTNNVLNVRFADTVGLFLKGGKLFNYEHGDTFRYKEPRRWDTIVQVLYITRFGVPLKGNELFYQKLKERVNADTLIVSKKTSVFSKEGGKRLVIKSKPPTGNGDYAGPDRFIDVYEDRMAFWIGDVSHREYVWEPRWVESVLREVTDYLLWKARN